MSNDQIQKISQIGIPVTDLNRAVPFYQNLLNLPLLFQTDRMAFFECGDVKLMLSLPESDAFAHPSSVIYFHVEDIHAAYQDLSDKGVAFRDNPHLIAKMDNTETWMVFFHDTEDNLHALMSEVPY
ncbi:VOC family protein [Camelliibacillus cellulosilyticus]|uniref:VOC family protein n=1 Tax=Camelliibacillus cellulosilyticus TaxID=2174486 RepID=A0ABV9GUT0_9BACL